jgi:hypothetical protein
MPRGVAELLAGAFGEVAHSLVKLRLVIGLEVEDPAVLVGPLDPPADQVHLPAADAAQPLGPFQEPVGGPQPRFALGPRGDVVGHADIALARQLAPVGRAGLHPHVAGLATGAQHLELHVERQRRGHAGVPRGQHPLAVAGMDRIAPATALGPLQGHPEQCLPALVAVEQRAACVGLEDGQRRAGGHRMEAGVVAHRRQLVQPLALQQQPLGDGG